MKARELIDLLNQVPDDAEVFVEKPKLPGQVEASKARVATVWSSKDESRIGILIERETP